MAGAHREYYQRQHRIVSHFLAIQAWQRGLECIVLIREDLEHLFNCLRFEQTRINWLLEDVTPWFPHPDLRYVSGVVSALFLSRVPIAAFIPNGGMTTEEQIASMALNCDAPKTKRFSDDGQERKAPSDAAIIAHLVLLAAGLELPRRIGKGRIKWRRNVIRPVRTRKRLTGEEKMYRELGLDRI